MKKLYNQKDTIEIFETPIRLGKFNIQRIHWTQEKQRKAVGNKLMADYHERVAITDSKKGQVAVENLV